MLQQQSHPGKTIKVVDSPRSVAMPHVQVSFAITLLLSLSVYLKNKTMQDVVQLKITTSTLMRLLIYLPLLEVNNLNVFEILSP